MLLVGNRLLHQGCDVPDIHHSLAGKCNLHRLHCPAPVTAVLTLLRYCTKQRTAVLETSIRAEHAQHAECSCNGWDMYMGSKSSCSKGHGCSHEGCCGAHMQVPTVTAVFFQTQPQTCSMHQALHCFLHVIGPATVAAQPLNHDCTPTRHAPFKKVYFLTPGASLCVHQSCHDYACAVLAVLL